MDNHLDYEGFRAQYEKQHPASVPQIEYDVHEYQTWVRWAVFFTFICAAMVSGIHTVPTVWQSIEVNEIVTESMRTVVAYASLFAIELAILLSAYLMAKGVKLAYFVMGIASLVAVLANLYSVSKAFDTGGELFAMVVSVALGIGAPTIALFSGKMFVDIHRADRIQDARAKKIYKEACVAWDSEIEKGWKSYQKDLSKGRTSSAVDNRLSIQTDNRQSGAGYSRTSSAVDLALDYLRSNPNAVDMSVRDLGAVAGVGKDSAAKARSQYLSENGNGNGHVN